MFTVKIIYCVPRPGSRCKVGTLAVQYSQIMYKLLVIGVGRIYAGGALYCCLKCDDFFSRRPHYTNYPPKLTTPPAPCCTQLFSFSREGALTTYCPKLSPQNFVSLPWLGAPAGYVCYTCCLMQFIETV